MDYKILDIDGPVIMIPKVWGDERGYFMETFRQADFDAHCGKYRFIQDNQSRSHGGVLRGLHYQLKHPQGKLVRVIYGTVFDVAVDLRISSPYFGKTYCVGLSAELHNIFWVPPGFAHGFLVLGDEAEFVYKCTDYYFPEDEHCILWNDDKLQVPWPLDNMRPILSEKDQRGTSFGKASYYE